MVLSPHGPAPGIYHRVSGTLGAFGLSHISVTARNYESSDEIPGIDRDLITGSVDHGIIVPLRLMAWDLPVIALAAADSDADRVGPAASAAMRAVRIIREIALRKRVAVMASLNTSASLSSRAPFPNDGNDPEPERRLLEILQTDVGLLKEEAAAITKRSHSCALSPLLAVAHLFDGRNMEVLAHEAPVGVGYLVAQVV